MLARIAIVALALFTLAGSPQMESQSKDSFNGFDLVDKAGNIAKPKDYRDKYQSLGAYTVLDPKGNQMTIGKTGNLRMARCW
jgi:hypothetical protein